MCFGYHSLPLYGQIKKHISQNDLFYVPRKKDTCEYEKMMKIISKTIRNQCASTGKWRKDK